MEDSELAGSVAHGVVDLIDFVSDSVAIKTILNKRTGSVSIASLDVGVVLAARNSPFENMIQVIYGVAEVMIDEQTIQVRTGQAVIIPAHSTYIVKAHEQFKMLSTVIKSGYEDVSL